MDYEYSYQTFLAVYFFLSLNRTLSIYLNLFYSLTASSRIHRVNEIYKLLMFSFHIYIFCTPNGVTFCLCRSTRSCSKSIELTNQTFYQTLFIHVIIQFRAIRLFEDMCFFSTRIFCKAKYMNIIKSTRNYLDRPIKEAFYFVSNCI